MKDLIKKILTENNEEERIKNYFLKKWKEQEKDGKIDLFIGIQDKLPMKCVTTLSDLRVGK